MGVKIKQILTKSLVYLYTAISILKFVLFFENIFNSLWLIKVFILISLLKLKHFEISMFYGKKKISKKYNSWLKKNLR